MLKKLLAGVSALALSLGMIALVAGPASAHTNSITASVACNTDDGTYTITWNVKNSEASNPETITASSNTAVVPLGTQIAGGGTGTFTQSVSSAGNYSLTLTGTWTNDNWVNEASGSISHQEFPHSCTPQLVKVTICHATPPDTAAQGWIPITIDDDAIDNHASHFTEHDDDIIPAYDYWVEDHGVWTKLHFDGKNLGTVFYGVTGAQILAAGCFVPVTPAAPTFNQAVCTDAGVAGNGSYVIPSTPGVVYSVSIDGGPFVVAAANTYSVVPVKTIVVKATSSDTGIYKLTGTTQWSATFNSAGDCILGEVSVTPTYTDAICTDGELSDSSYTLTAVTGIDYQVSTDNVTFTPIAAGQHVVPAGTHIWITASAETGYSITGATSWDHLFPTPLCDGVPTDPTATDRACIVNEDGHGSFVSGYITIPDSLGVQYYIDGTAVDPGKILETPGIYQVTATAKDGFALTSDYPDGGWSLTIHDAAGCGVVHPVEPNVVDQTCQTREDSLFGLLVTGYIDIPSTVGVNYYIDGVLAAAGHHDLVPGDYTVTVAAIPNYTLADNVPKDGWVETINPALDCIQETTDASVFPIVTSTQGSCTVDGTYTLSNDILDGAPDFPGAAGAVIFTVDGSPVAAGTYHVTAPKTVHVHAAPNTPDYTFDDPNQQVDWTLTFAAATTCDLKTLALTGTQPAGGMLLAYFMLLAGLGIVAVRTVRRHGRPQE